MPTPPIPPRGAARLAGAPLTVLLALGLGCERSPPSQPPRPATVLWQPLGLGDPYAVEAGQLEAGRAHALSRWFGRAEETEQDVPDLLSDSRECLLASTPARFTAQIPAAEGGRVLRTAVRRLADGPGAAERAAETILAQVFVTSGKEPLLLAEARLTAGGAPIRWQELQATLPDGGPLLLAFITRHADPALGALPGAAVAWADPRVIQTLPEHPKPAGGRQPDVLILSIDALRSDALEHAPRLEAIARRGLLWRRALSPSNWTLPSYASLFTALDADRHGAGRGPFPARAEGQLAERDYRRLDPSLPTLAEQFRRAGYATAFLHQNPFLEPWSGVERGFGRHARTRDDPQAGVQVARAWWAEQEGAPRFLVLHLMGPHLPYRLSGREHGLPEDPLGARPWRDFLARDHLPAERRAFFDLPAHEREAVRALYRAEVAALDAVVAPWVEELLGGQHPPLFVLHSDHGEELWDAGSFEHGHSFEDAVALVPLAVVGPLRPADFDPSVPARVRDLGPSLLEWVGLPRPSGWTGGLLQPYAQARCLQPLYRAEAGGRVEEPGRPQPLLLPFDRLQCAARGEPAELGPDLESALAELGYAAAPAGDRH